VARRDLRMLTFSLTGKLTSTI